MYFYTMQAHPYLHQLDDGILITTRDGTITSANPALQRLIRGDREVTGDLVSFFSSFPGSSTGDEADLLAEITGAVQRGRPLWNREIHLMHPDGEEQWVELSMKKTSDDHLIWIFRGITRWKRAEAILREREEKYRLLFHGGNDAIVVYRLTPEGHPEEFIEANEIACRRLGYSRGELGRLSPADIVPPDRVGEVLGIVKRFLIRDHLRFETEHVRSNGSRFPVEINAHRIPLGDQVAILSISRDISERRRNEEIQKKSFSQIEENIEQFAILGDHIRNPLGAIIGYAEFCDPAYLGKIHDQADLIRAYLDQLDQGWIESEKVREFIRRHYR